MPSEPTYDARRSPPGARPPGKGATLSLASIGVRRQVGIAVALITVIPLLVLGYALVVAAQAMPGTPIILAILLVFCSVSIGVGFAIMCRFPINLLRLRRYLEHVVAGHFHEDADLVKGIRDVDAIESALTFIVDKLSARLDDMEREVDRVETLLEDESSDGKGA